MLQSTRRISKLVNCFSYHQIPSLGFELSSPNRNPKYRLFPCLSICSQSKLFSSTTRQADTLTMDEHDETNNKMDVDDGPPVKSSILNNGDKSKSSSTSVPPPSSSSTSGTQEGKVRIEYDSKRNIFYNPTQEINRDMSILGIQSFIERTMKADKEVEEKKNKKINRDFNILEAMAASGIRSIRYAKEIENVSKILANDLSAQAIESLNENSVLNETTHIIEPSCQDASLLMMGHKSKFFVVDLDPYGSPIPFLDSAVQCVASGGMLLVTATDMAVLAGGNTPESCYSKYGSMSIKTKACQEMALRILIHAVQSFANRYGKHVEPLISLKIDFYIRIFFRVVYSPILCKQTAMQTSMFYQCTGCHSLHFQPLVTQKNPNLYAAAKGPPIGPRCDLCDSSFHVGGPIWTGKLHNKEFLADMIANANSDRFEYLGTRRRIQGLLQLVVEELDTVFYYETAQLASVLKCRLIPILSLRSALLNLGYKVSSSHAEVGTFKTDAPILVIYQMFHEWWRLGNDGGGKIKEGTPGFKLVQTLDSKDPATRPTIDFNIHPDANPTSRETGALRFQVNPTKNWGPGTRNRFGKKSSEENSQANQNEKQKKQQDSESSEGGKGNKRKKYTHSDANVDSKPKGNLESAICNDKTENTNDNDKGSL